MKFVGKTFWKIKQKFQESLSFSLNFIGNDDICLYEGRVCERDFRSGGCSPYQERYPLTWPERAERAPTNQCNQVGWHDSAMVTGALL